MTAAPAPQAAVLSPAPAPVTKRAPAAVVKAGKMTKFAQPTLSEENKSKLEQMFALAREMGYSCQDVRSIRADLGQQIYARMTNRVGKSIFQMMYLSQRESLSMGYAFDEIKFSRNSGI